jgi:hypothetical protein
LGEGLLILLEVVVWGIVILGLGALLESGWARIRRRGKQTLVD